MNLYCIFGIAALGLSACATPYVESSELSPHATLNFVNENHLIPRQRPPIKPIEQKYASVSDQSCRESARFVNFRQEDKDYKPIRVQSDKEISVLAHNIYGGSYYGGERTGDITLGTTSKSCKSIATFVPKEGGNYIVRMLETDKKVCELFVIDYETKSAPSDLVVKNSFACG